MKDQQSCMSVAYLTIPTIIKTWEQYSMHDFMVDL